MTRATESDVSVATDPRRRLAQFAGYLREHGYALGYAEVELMVRTAAALPLPQWPRIESLWRPIAAGNRRQWLKYPDLHQAFWFPHRVKGSTRSSGLTRRGRTLPELMQQMHGELGGSAPAAGRPNAAHHDGAADEETAPRAQGGASRTEALDRRDFADWNPQDIDRFEPLVEAFQRRLRMKLLRRWQASAGADTVHLRRSLRAALGSGGELL